MSSLKIILKITIAFCTVVGILFGAYRFLTGNIFRIQDIEVELDNKASYNYIFPKIKETLDMRMMTLFGQYVWRVDLEKILKTVESDLRIKDAKITRVLPNTIHISVSPYTPIANILGKNTKQLYPVARDGEVLPPIAITDAPDGTILRGENFVKDRELRLSAIELLLALPESGSLSLKTVSEIYFHKKKGFQLRLQKSGAEVWMGSDKFAHRVSQAQRVVDYLEREQLTGRISDARYGKKVVVKLKSEL
ncbi:MAG: FtsQ-type POTRA domain-containing protein [Bdellovibrionales bacterium]|nr:FtsQ-type POTRA domain-containing protein [Bdellovibrionales bacterium]